MSAIKYPTPHRADTKEVLHGVTVADPYRWMEDPDAEETKAFVDAQNEISRAYLDRCPDKTQLKESLTKLWNFPKFTAPFRYGDSYYYHFNSGLQNQYVLYAKKELKGKAEVFLDPNTLSDDGTISLSDWEFSESGKYFCYGLSESGSDWSTLYVRDVAQKNDLPDKIERVRYTRIAWTRDEKGFFYGQYSEWTGKIVGTESKNVENQKLFYHRVSTCQSEDVMCVEFPDHPTWRISPQVSDCGRYVVLHVNKDCQYVMVYVADISAGVKSRLDLTTIYGKFDCRISYITNEGPVFYFRTNKDRPNFGVVKFDINDPLQTWTDVIPENPKHVLQWVSCVNKDKLVVGYCEDVVTKVKVFKLSGELLQTLPFELGTVGRVSGLRKHSEVFFRFSSLVTPGKIYRCEIDKAPNAVLEEHDAIRLQDISTDDIETQQVFYPSLDGTKVPMFVMRKKGTPRDGSSKCLLYVYGGFNISVLPDFSLFRLMLVKRLDFTVAIANVRGGAEYGQKWHDGGRLKHKQNTFDDVHAAAAFLADGGYTRASRLALMGGSNGGMVATACANQRPELFGAIVAKVPVTDLYRFHKFTIGHAWCSDFGNPDVADDFGVQVKYSPLHNIPTNIDHYPSILVTTADHDDRVVPSHSLKFIAELQHRLGAANKHPLLALIDTKAGHGAGKPTTKVIEELVEIMCFLQNALAE